MSLTSAKELNTSNGFHIKLQPLHKIERGEREREIYLTDLYIVHGIHRRRRERHRHYSKRETESKEALVDLNDAAADKTIFIMLYT